MAVRDDVGKSFHRVCVLNEEDSVVLSRRVEPTERDIEACCGKIVSLIGDRRVAIYPLGGPATLLAEALDAVSDAGARSTCSSLIPGARVRRRGRGDPRASRRTAVPRPRVAGFRLEKYIIP